MTPSQRFLAAMRFQPFDRAPLSEWRPWDSTLQRWQRETGLDHAALLAWLDDCDPEENAGVDFAMHPPFDKRIVAEDAQSFTVIDRMGQTMRLLRSDPQGTMPQFVAPPVQSASDWHDIKRRFDPSTAARYPADWALRVARWQRDQPIVRLYGFCETYYGGPSLFGFARMLLGEERVLYAFYDEPELIDDMMETATDFAIAVMRRALREAPVTLVQFWEDMCYRGGPLISPDLFRRFMSARYRRITDAIRAAGVDIIFVDSDGDVSALIPLWLESGINGVFPLEQACGNDPWAYRREYGTSLLMAGGIDKRVLAQGPEPIDAELARKLPLAEQGGYLPTLDHAIPPDVSHEHFQHYWARKKELLHITQSPEMTHG